MRFRFLLLLLGASVAINAQNAAVTINVDATENRHPIDPNIYGVAFASTAELSDLNVPLNRSGGNAESQYNWQLNASNRGADWYYESIAENSATAGEHGDTFISDTKASGAQAMLTVPMVGWVAKLGPSRGKLSSFSIAKYGAQQDADWQWMPDAGNGVKSNGSEITNNDPNDANVSADSMFQQGWVQHIVSKWGAASSGGLRYYILDNEHSIWHATHRDVHPTGATMDEIATKMIDYGDRVKSVDASALVAGPEEWGWGGYFYSGYDQQWGAAHGYSGYPDRAAHFDSDYVAFLLHELHAYDVMHTRRLLDVFTLHYYPQGGEYSNDTSTSMQQRRNRSTRSLWDPSYTDESWIGDKVKLIPRMHDWVDSIYPGTKLGITEYSWGAESHMNGATTQADILGIFGRESLDLATRWTTPASTTPVYKSIKMYRNYDGSKSVFGNLSVSATAPNPDNVSAFAAVRASDKALTVMIISKALSGTTPATVNLANYTTSGNAQRWELASNAITHQADVTISSGSLSLTLPAQSVTLLVIPGNTDVANPSITISPSFTFNDGNYTFSGTASDDASISKVTYALSGATFGSGNASGTTSWSAGPFRLNRGRTTITATAVDASGNRMSATMSVDVVGVAMPAPARRRAAGH